MKKLTPKEKEAQLLILSEIDKALDLLQGHLQKYCNEVAPMYNGGQKVDTVPLAYIERSIKTIKENYKKGADKT